MRDIDLIRALNEMRNQGHCLFVAVGLTALEKSLSYRTVMSSFMKWRFLNQHRRAMWPKVSEQPSWPDTYSKSRKHWSAIRCALSKAGLS